MSRRSVRSGAKWEDIAGYSRAVQVGDTIWVSGTTAPGETAADQLRASVAIIEAALVELGASLHDVVRTRMFVTDISGWEPIAQAHGELFGDIRPATSMVEVSALVEPWMTVEIEAVARISTDA